MKPSEFSGEIIMLTGVLFGLIFSVFLMAFGLYRLYQYFNFYQHVYSNRAWPETAGTVINGYTGYIPESAIQVHYNPVQPEEHVSMLDKSRTHLVVSLVVFLFGFLGVIAAFVAK